jgi:hypothetical protein
VLVRLALLFLPLARIFFSACGIFAALARGLPRELATFPLAPFMRRRVEPINFEAGCTSSGTSLDIIVSLYRPLSYSSTFVATLRACPGNPNISYRVLLIKPTMEEVLWAKKSLEGSNHTLDISDDLIGIYEAWNRIILTSEADFLANVNADDMRLPHSFCRQMSILNTEESDVVFSNFLLSNVPWSSSTRFPSWISRLPDFSLSALLIRSRNLPHCSPMWRSAVHQEVGLFNGDLKSSGDSEFWARCAVAGRKFDKDPLPAVVYFHNPEGLSTSTKSPGRAEWRNIQKRSVISWLVRRG